MLTEYLKNDLLKPTDFKFDIEESRGLITGNNLLERGELRNLLRSGAGNLDARDLGIVTDDWLTICGKADVEFKAITAVLKGEVEGCDCIFRNRSRAAGAAMAEEE